MDVKVLFSYPVSEFGKIIDWAEGPGEDPSHTGIIMLGGILEALDNGFVKSPLTAYDGFKTTILSVDYDLLGVTVPGDGEKTVDCSEAVTRILQAGGLEIFLDFPADNVTPADLLRKLLVIKQGEKVR
ncbi:MAG: hypothetical protein H6Q74_230 [Firmicutes bacterium]|nr:hypothetical protein [Bacillota bacterium]